MFSERSFEPTNLGADSGALATRARCSTINNYDAANRLTSIRDAAANPPTVYGSDNRRTSVQDPNGNTNSFAAVFFVRWIQRRRVSPFAEDSDPGGSRNGSTEMRS